MNNRPTPETDDLAITCYIDSVIEGVFGFRAVPIDDCRKLERERDDLQKAVNGLCEHFKVSPANTTLLAVEVLKIERERNTARAQFVAALDGRDMANEEADKLREQNVKLRDIAKRAICLLRMRGYACTESMRDSLRVELDQLEGAK
jgi:hypothetical protein